MKGYFIEVTNNLLDPKHHDAIGTAVWEFMWCLDKVTLIAEDGIGWVWGRKPVLVTDITSEIGGKDRQTRENLNRLEAEGYIIRVRTPRGMSIGVRKAKKRFGRSDRQETAERPAGNRRSNIRQYTDSKQRKAMTKSLPSSKVLRSMEYVPTDGEGNELPGKKKAGGVGLNKLALRIRRKFGDLCEKHLGTRPVDDVKSYQIILFALKKGKLTEDQIYDLFDEWFKLGKPDEESIAITRALSGRQIEGYKVRNNVK